MSIIIILWFLISVVALVIYVKVIVNIINNPEINNNSKIFWIVLVLVANLLGLIIYFVVQDKNVLQ